MTTPTVAAEVERRRGRPTRARTLLGSFLAEARALQVERGHVAANERWPSTRYRDDPVGFFREVLGVEPWSRQIEVIDAVRDHPRVAVSSGHKVGKSLTAAGLALWYYCSFEDARVVMSSTTSRQVDQILWREVRMLRARAKRPIDGEMHELARSGLKAADFREIVGFTAREAEAVAGISGKHLLYILDEASGIDDAIFEAIEGNRAGGARLVMFSNPTRTEGEFFEAFTKKSDFYKTIRISSEESPNVAAGREVIPALAGRDWIEEKRREWGEDSPEYKVRVKGQHVLRDEAKIISIHAIAEAEKAWYSTPENGPLFIGLDPAGESGDGDETVFAVRRGMKVMSLYAHRGLTPDDHLAHLLGIVRKYRKPREPAPTVVVDSDGGVGARVSGRLRAYVDAHPEDFDLVRVRSSDRADGNNPHRAYDLVRDKLWFNLSQWLKEGGAIPEDVKLAKELHAPEWRRDVRGRDKVTSKDDLRKALKRSPDRADAVALSVWEVRTVRDDRSDDGVAEVEEDIDYRPVTSPYRGLDAWRPRRS